MPYILGVSSWPQRHGSSAVLESTRLQPWPQPARTAAVVMSLVQSAKLSGHDPWAYLKDVLTRLPTHLNSRIDELLPHLWQQPG